MNASEETPPSHLERCSVNSVVVLTLQACVTCLAAVQQSGHMKTGHLYLAMCIREILNQMLEITDSDKVTSIAIRGHEIVAEKRRFLVQLS